MKKADLNQEEYDCILFAQKGSGTKSISTSNGQSSPVIAHPNSSSFASRVEEERRKSSVFSSSKNAFKGNTILA